MLKVYDSAVTFAEFPDEVTLAVNISSCPGFCSSCSEPWLLEDVGEELTEQKIDELIAEHPDITVFGLMGGDNDHDDVVRIANYVHEKHNLKVGIYSGREYLNQKLLAVLDYYKIGRWIMPDMEHPETWKDHTWGPLVWPVSNQLMFKKHQVGDETYWLNITHKFREKPIGNWKQYIITPEQNNN